MDSSPLTIRATSRPTQAIVRSHLLAMVWLTVAGWPHLAAGQDASQAARISRLRGELAGRFDVEPEVIQLLVPPAVAITPGSMICITAEQGIEVIDRLPESRVREQPAPDGDLRDAADIREDATLWKQLFGSRAEPPSGAVIQIEIRDIRRLSLEEGDPQRLAEQVLRSRTAVAAFQERREPLLVHDVYVGKVQFEIRLNPGEGAELKTILPGFRLESDENGPLRVIADQEVPFAFRASALNFRLENGKAAAVVLQPVQTTQKNASAWELAASPLTASAAGPDAPDGHDVTVLYATCRAVNFVPPTIRSLMLGFIVTANGLITLFVVAIGVLVGVVALGLGKLLTPTRLAVVAAMGMALFTMVAWIDAARQQSLAAKIAGVYGNKRGELRYGLSNVSIPRKRRTGEFNTPFSFYVIQLPEDPEKHFVVTELLEDREAFFRELKSKISASSARNAFVFIHGYNVPFEDAVKRTAQLTVDLKFAGAPICYSWPSQGDLADYVQDSTNAEVAAYKLKQLLSDLNEQSGAKEIHLVAHSMGNDVLTRALKELGKETLGQTNCVFREVLLTAPDIDTELFQTEILPAFMSSKQRITLYASSNDKALNASFKLRGSPRAGLAGEYLLVLKGIETIDVSDLDTGFLGHAYYGDHPLVVGDMQQVLCDHLPPAQRRLRENAKGGIPYWEFVR